MLEIQRKTIFKRDIRRIKKRGKDMEKLKEVMSMLIEEKPLPAKYKNHPLIGNYVDCKECHIEPDWLLIYKIKKNMVTFIRTGTHTELFD